MVICRTCIAIGELHGYTINIQYFITAIKKTRDAVGAEDSVALRVAVDELSGLTYKMTETLYAELGGDDGED